MSKNNKSIKTIDTLQNMEVDYNWNGQYYCESNDTQPAPVVSVQSQTCADTQQSSITDGNFSLLYFILMIVYLIYYQITNINDINMRLNKIDNQVSQIEEAILQMKNSLNMMVEICNYNAEQKNDKNSNVFLK